MKTEINTLKVISQLQLSAIEGKAISFLNFASIGKLLENRSLLQRDIHYCCDGILLAIFISIVTREKVKRLSFDLTSIANDVFKHAENEDLKIYFIGATESQVFNFHKKIKEKFGRLKVVGYRSGYFTEESVIIEEIKSLDTDIVLIGLGAGKQEDFMNNLRNHSFKGTMFSCGGFIRQYSDTKNEMYYPAYVNALNLRAFYRMLKEPHTIRRYLFEYPANLLSLVKMIVFSKVKIKIK